MKFSKLGVMFAAASIAVGAFADAANVLVSFSTEADYYADGTSVKDGEWYALCWSPRTTFGGLDLACKPVVSGDRVLILAPLAKDGHCPYTLFQLTTSEVPSGSGYYFVFVLDTRNAAGTAVASAGTRDGRNVPATEVNGMTVSKNFSASASVGQGVVDSGETVASVDWSESVVVGDITTASITAIKVENSKVKLTVEGMMPGVKYNVQMGSSPNALTSYALEVPKTVADDATFELAPSDARFFKIVRQPLTK